MNQFDVCENLEAEEKERAPYWVILQSKQVNVTNVCVVAPLVRLRFIEPMRRLNPTFEIDREVLALSMLEITSTHRRWIGRRVGSLDQDRDKIIAAVDMLFTGF